MLISSAQNPKLKLVRALLTQNKARRQEGRFVLEGVRLVEDVIDQGFLPDFVLHKPEEPAPSLPPEVEVLPVEPQLFDQLSDTQHNQGILAVFPIPRLTPAPDASLLVAVDALRDPGNLGTIIRTAAAAGANGLILLNDTVDPFNPKVVRAGMGAHFRLPLLDKLPSGDWQIVCAATTPQDAQPYTAPVWQMPTVLVIGSEAHGISRTLQDRAHEFVFIPMASGVESLNSSVAAAVLLFEIRRQRNA